MLYVLPTCIGIIGSKGFKDLAKGNIVSDELFGVHLHLVLLYKATKAVDLNDPWRGKQPGSDQPVLDGSEFHGVFALAGNHVLIDFTQSRANRSHDRLSHENLWNLIFCRLQTF